MIPVALAVWFAASPVQVDAADYATRVVEPHRGRILVVHLWSTHCGYCMREMPTLLAWASAHTASVDFVLVADAPSPDDAALRAALNKWRAVVPSFVYDSRVGHDDDDVFERTVDPGWHGIMPHTIVYDRSGRRVQALPGAVTPASLSGAVDAVAGAPSPSR